MLWLRFGLGRHVAWVVQDDPTNIERFFKTIVANEMFYTTALACARLSLVAFFYQIFGVSSMRYFLHGFVFLIISWAISTVRVLNTPFPQLTEGIVRSVHPYMLAHTYILGRYTAELYRPIQVLRRSRYRWDYHGHWANGPPSSLYLHSQGPTISQDLDCNDAHFRKLVRQYWTPDISERLTLPVRASLPSSG